MSVAVIAQAAISALGETAWALAPERVGDVARSAIAHDAVLAAAGLARPRSGRITRLDDLPVDVVAAAGPDRAARLLALALVDLAGALDACTPSWRELRLGLALGTSSGGMASIEELFRARASGADISPDLARRATYFGPIGPALAAIGLEAEVFVERVHFLAACAASTFAVGAGMRWLERDAVDLVIAGGYDALSLLVASGFEAIRATSSTSPRPFRLGREGMALGEGAGLVALARGAGPLSRHASFHVHGFGAATDAVHITAPDRTGDGLARAAERALADAGAAPEEIAFVSAHATATPFNDTMEASAIRRVTRGLDPVVQALKAQIGHTLGAAGILETLGAAACLARGLAPAAAGQGDVDPGARVRLLDQAQALGEVHAGGDPLVLKCSAAFGGANAALVIGASPRPLRPPRAIRRVALGPSARVRGSDDARAALDAASIPLERRAKLDSLSLLACGAVARLAAAGAPLAGGGIVVGHALATLDVDERYFARILARGGAGGEPRLFPATSPNVSAGHAAILFELRGPSAAVSGGLDGGVEALAIATELVAAGDADGVVVVAVDEAGPASSAVLAAGFPGREAAPTGAFAVWISAGAAGVEVPIGLRPDHRGPWAGHVSLEACIEALASGARTA